SGTGARPRAAAGSAPWRAEELTRGPADAVVYPRVEWSARFYGSRGSDALQGGLDVERRARPPLGDSPGPAGPGRPGPGAARVQLGRPLHRPGLLDAAEL